MGNMFTKKTDIQKLEETLAELKKQERYQSGLNSRGHYGTFNNKAKSNTLKQIESNIKRTENELKQAKAQNPGSPLNKLTGGRRKRTKKRRTRRA